MGIISCVQCLEVSRSSDFLNTPFPSLLFLPVIDSQLTGRVGQLELRRFVESLGVIIDTPELR